jgi:hypothetical protein
LGSLFKRLFSGDISDDGEALLVKVFMTMLLVFDTGVEGVVVVGTLFTLF